MNTKYNYARFIHDCQVYYIEPIIVLDATSLTTLGGRMSQTQRLKRAYKLFPTVKFWEIGNEPDGIGNASSSAMTHFQYISLLRAAKLALPNVHKIFAGLCFTDPYWFKTFMNSKWGPEALDIVDSLAIHQYGVYPSEDFQYPDTGFGPASASINMMLQYGKPLWITEFGGQVELFDDIHQKAEWVGRMITLYRQYDNHDPELLGANYFMYNNYDSHGMIDDQGNPNEVYAAFAGAT